MRRLHSSIILLLNILSALTKDEYKIFMRIKYALESQSVKVDLDKLSLEEGSSLIPFLTVFEFIL